MENLGIVLSGGGVKGVAHIGLIQALREQGIQPKYVAGTSAGALVGAMYAADWHAKDMIDFFKGTPLFSWYYYSTNKPGILDTEKYRSHFEKFFGIDDFADLSKKLIITTTNLEKAQTVYHSTGELITPLMASCSVPLVFSPLSIQGQLHADGGIMNNFPVEPLQELGLKHILGSFACSVMHTQPKDLNTSLKVMYRSFDLSTEALCRYKFPDCDYVFAPKELANIGFLDSKSVDEAYKVGYESAIKDMDQILDSLLIEMPLQSMQALESNDITVELGESETTPLKQEETTSTSYFDFWPLNWAFGTTAEKESKKEEITA